MEHSCVVLNASALKKIREQPIPLIGTVLEAYSALTAQYERGTPWRYVWINSANTYEYGQAMPLDAACLFIVRDVKTRIEPSGTLLDSMPKEEIDALLERAIVAVQKTIAAKLGLDRLTVNQGVGSG